MKLTLHQILSADVFISSQSVVAKLFIMSSTWNFSCVMFCFYHCFAGDKVVYAGELVKVLIVNFDLMI